MPGGGKKNKGNEGENSVEMGKKVKPAWEKDNSLRKRSCTDLPCLLIFLAFIGGMVREAMADPRVLGTRAPGLVSFIFMHFLSTAREGNVFTGVCRSVHNRPHAYSITAHPCWLLGHFLQCGRYASYWNAFLFEKKFAK